MKMNYNKILIKQDGAYALPEVPETIPYDEEWYEAKGWMYNIRFNQRIKRAEKIEKATN